MPGTLGNDVQFLKTHERLLLGLALLVTILWLGNQWINSRANLANQRYGAAQAALQVQIDVNKQLAQQAADAQQQYQRTLLQVTAQITARQVKVTKQKEAEKTLPLTGIADRWAKLVPLVMPLSVTQDSVIVPDQDARITTQTLEDLPVLKADLNDKTNQVNSLSLLVDTLNKQSAGLSAQIGDANKACDAKVQLLKAQQRKKSRNWFIKGLIIGAGVVAYLIHP